MLKALTRSLSAITLCIASAAGAATPNVGDHNQVQPLPINGMVAAVKNGKIAFVSSNGRFVFQGTAYDTWNKKNITTIDEARHANEYLNLTELKFDVDDLEPMTVGSGPKEVVIFFDPYCGSCHQLIEDAQLVDGYTYKLVPIPAMGDDSIKAVRFAFCTADKDLSKKVLQGKVKPKDIPNDKFESCDTTALAKRVITTQLLGLMGVPFLIRDDGLVRAGYVKGDIKNWLARGR